MIDSYVFDPNDILSLEYLRESDLEEVVCPSLLRDFTLVSTRYELLSNTGVRMNIYVKSSNSRVSIMSNNPDKPGPQMFDCNDRGILSLDQLASDSEANIGHHYSTHFLIPFDPSVPMLWLDTADSCYKLSLTTAEQQIGIFAGFIERLRRL